MFLAVLKIQTYRSTVDLKFTKISIYGTTLRKQKGNAFFSFKITHKKNQVSEILNSFRKKGLWIF